MNNTITLSQLITRLAGTASVDNNTARRFLRAFFDTITAQLAQGETVVVKGIGTFEPVKDINGDKNYSIKFMPDSDLAAELNRPFEMFSPVELAQGVDFDSCPEDVPHLPEIDPESSDTTPVEPTVDTEPEAESTTADEETQTETAVITPAESDEITAAETTETAEPVVTTTDNDLCVTEPTTIDEPCAAANASDSATETDDNDGQDDESYVISTFEPTANDSSDQDTSQIIEDEREKRGSNIWLWAGIIVVLAIAAGYGAAVMLTPIGQQYDNDSEPTDITETVVEATPTDTVSGITEVELPTVAATATPATTPTPVQATVEDEIEPVYDTVELSLSQLARKHYRQSLYWVFIYEANRDIVSDPNRIKPGTKVLIPEVSTFPGENAEQTRQIAKQRQTEILNKYSGR